MVETYQRRSPLAHLGLVARAAASRRDGAGVIMSEVPHRTIVNIRGNAADHAFAAAVQSATGVALPGAANTVSTGGGGFIGTGSTCP